MTDEDDRVIRELADRQEITDLLTAYCRAVDLYHPDEVAALFTEDCVVDYGETLGGASGAAAVASSLRAGLARYEATSHSLSNVHVVFDGPDRAEGITYVHAWHKMRGGKPDAHLWAQYHDVFVRTPEGWRIAERRLQVLGEHDFPLAWHKVDRAPVES